MVVFISQLENDLNTLGKLGLNPQIDEAVNSFLNRIRLADTERAGDFAAAFGMGAIVSACIQHPKLLETPDLLRALGVHFAGAFLNTVWPQTGNVDA